MKSGKCKYKHTVYDDDCHNWSGDYFHFKDCDGCLFLDIPNSTIDKVIRGFTDSKDAENRLKKVKIIAL